MTKQDAIEYYKKRFPDYAIIENSYVGKIWNSWLDKKVIFINCTIVRNSFERCVFIDCKFKSKYDSLCCSGGMHLYMCTFQAKGPKYKLDMVVNWSGSGCAEEPDCIIELCESNADIYFTIDHDSLRKCYGGTESDVRIRIEFTSLESITIGKSIAFRINPSVVKCLPDYRRAAILYSRMNNSAKY